MLYGSGYGLPPRAGDSEEAPLTPGPNGGAGYPLHPGHIGRELKKGRKHIVKETEEGTLFN